MWWCVSENNYFYAQLEFQFVLFLTYSSQLFSHSYLYANQRGCDGGRLYFDGSAMIICNGKILAQANQFDVSDVQVITATVDLDDVRSYRASIPSLGIQAADLSQHYVLGEDVIVLSDYGNEGIPTIPLEGPKYHTPEEECCLGPACWLWDYLRRTGASGYFLPLSGELIYIKMELSL